MKRQKVLTLSINIQEVNQTMNEQGKYLKSFEWEGLEPLNLLCLHPYWRHGRMEEEISPQDTTQAYS